MTDPWARHCWNIAIQLSAFLGQCCLPSLRWGLFSYCILSLLSCQMHFPVGRCESGTLAEPNPQLNPQGADDPWMGRALPACSRSLLRGAKSSQVIVVQYCCSCSTFQLCLRSSCLFLRARQHSRTIMYTIPKRWTFPLFPILCHYKKNCCVEILLPK